MDSRAFLLCKFKSLCGRGRLEPVVSLYGVLVDPVHDPVVPRCFLVFCDRSEKRDETAIFAKDQVIRVSEPELPFIQISRYYAAANHAGDWKIVDGQFLGQELLADCALDQTVCRVNLQAQNLPVLFVPSAPMSMLPAAEVPSAKKA